jgi:shikimate 5-dehydrogenase
VVRRLEVALDADTGQVVVVGRGGAARAAHDRRVDRSRAALVCVRNPAANVETLVDELDTDIEVANRRPDQVRADISAAVALQKPG